MKTCALYGFIWALAGALLTLILFFAGFHSDQAKMSAAGWIGGLLGIAIAITTLVLGIKARRAELPAGQDFGYGKAFGAGVLISVVSSILTSIFTYLYWSFINPGIAEVISQSQQAKFEAAGITGDRLDKMMEGVRKMSTPVPQALIVLIFGIIFGIILSLVIAAILKSTRVEPDAPPVV